VHLVAFDLCYIRAGTLSRSASKRPKPTKAHCQIESSIDAISELEADHFEDQAKNSSDRTAEYISDV
jgi:hypothetical protein